MTLFLTDNTPLVGFGHIDRLDLLARLMNQKGAWTLTVSVECDRSARVAGLEVLAGSREIFGDPLIPSPAERLDSQLIRGRLAAPTDPPAKHLGEAETLAIIAARHPGAYLVSDDLGALDEAGRMEIKTVTTGELLRFAVRARFITAQEAWDARERLRAIPHFLARTPAGHAEFMAWCAKP